MTETNDDFGRASDPRSRIWLPKAKMSLLRGPSDHKAACGRCDSSPMYNYAFGASMNSCVLVCVDYDTGLVLLSFRGLFATGAGLDDMEFFAGVEAGLDAVDDEVFDRLNWVERAVAAVTSARDVTAAWLWRGRSDSASPEAARRTLRARLALHECTRAKHQKVLDWLEPGRTHDTAGYVETAEDAYEH